MGGTRRKNKSLTQRIKAMAYPELLLAYPESLELSPMTFKVSWYHEG